MIPLNFYKYKNKQLLNCTLTLEVYWRQNSESMNHDLNKTADERQNSKIITQRFGVKYND